MRHDHAPRCTVVHTSQYNNDTITWTDSVRIGYIIGTDPGLFALRKLEKMNQDTRDPTEYGDIPDLYLDGAMRVLRGHWEAFLHDRQLDHTMEDIWNDWLTFADALANPFVKTVEVLYRYNDVGMPRIRDWMCSDAIGMTDVDEKYDKAWCVREDIRACKSDVSTLLPSTWLRVPGQTLIQPARAPYAVVGENVPIVRHAFMYDDTDEPILQYTNVAVQMGDNTGRRLTDMDWWDAASPLIEEPLANAAHGSDADDLVVHIIHPWPNTWRRTSLARNQALDLAASHLLGNQMFDGLFRHGDDALCRVSALAYWVLQPGTNTMKFETPFSTTGMPIDDAEYARISVTQGSVRHAFLRQLTLMPTILRV